jgi:hypothetical protein
MPIVPPSEIPLRNRRRSKRVQHKTPVTVRFQDANKHPISETTHTIVVNDHGALILLAAGVQTQQIIHLENPGLGEEVLCRVASLGETLMGKINAHMKSRRSTKQTWQCRASQRADS